RSEHTLEDQRELQIDFRLGPVLKSEPYSALAARLDLDNIVQHMPSHARGAMRFSGAFSRASRQSSSNSSRCCRAHSTISPGSRLCIPEIRPRVTAQDSFASPVDL